MKTLTVNPKEFAAQVNKAKVFAGTSGTEALEDKKSLEFQVVSNGVNLVASSRSLIDERHTVASYFVGAKVDVAANRFASTVDAKELTEAAKKLDKAATAANIRYSVDELFVGDTKVTVRPFILRGVRELTIKAENEASTLVVLEKAQVSAIKRNVIPFSGTHKYRPLLSNLVFKDGIVEATDSYGAVKFKLHDFEGSTVVNNLAFKHVKMSDTVTIRAGKTTSILATSAVKVYTSFQGVDFQPSLDSIFDDARDNAIANISINTDTLVEALKVIQDAYDKEANILAIQRGNRLHLLHCESASQTEANYHGTVEGVGEGEANSSWNMARMIKWIGKHKSVMNLQVSESYLKPMYATVGEAYRMVMMPVRPWKTGMELAIEKVDNDVF